MHTLVEFFIWFSLLGLVEAVLKPIAILYTRWKILKVFPQVVDALDPIMPELIKEKSGLEIEAWVRDFLEEKTGEDWSQTNIEYFWRRYDVRAAADKKLVVK